MEGYRVHPGIPGFIARQGIRALRRFRLEHGPSLESQGRWLGGEKEDENIGDNGIHYRIYPQDGRENP